MLQLIIFFYVKLFIMFQQIFEVMVSFYSGHPVL
jgi:hypothetical protein